MEIDREVPYQVAGNADYRERLAEHLVLLYGRGDISYEDSPDLMGLFFEKAPQSVREHALAHIGRSLQNENAHVPRAVIERFKTLWERRVEAVRDLPTKAERSELTAFGSWFVCDKFERRWLLDCLRESLELCGWSEPDHAAVKHLAAIAVDFPEDTVSCLSLLVDGDKDGLCISLWREHTRSILKAALDSAVGSARSDAVEVINRLCARGSHTCRDLLPIH